MNYLIPHLITLLFKSKLNTTPYLRRELLNNIADRLKNISDSLFIRIVHVCINHWKHQTTYAGHPSPVVTVNRVNIAYATLS